MLVTSSRNTASAIVNDIFKRTKKLTAEQKKLINDVVALVRSTNNYHKDYDSQGFISWFVNPILLEQYFTIYEDGRLVAFLSYGKLNKEAEHKWLTCRNDFVLADWNSGDSLWLIDCIAPHGHGAEICSIARDYVAKHGFANRKVRFKRIYRSGREKVSSSTI